MSEKDIDKDTMIELNLWDKVPPNFLFSFGYHADELTIILKGHLFCEYLMDQIIKEKIKRPNNILNYTFSKKLEILFSLDIISDYIHKNISNLNKIRNKYAHNLDYGYNLDELVFVGTKNQNLDFKKYKKKSKRQIMKLFCFSVLAQFNDYIYLKLNMKPTVKNNFLL